MKSQNTSSQTYIDNNNNNIYQGLIQTKTILIPIIRDLRLRKYQQKVIEQQPAPSPTVMKSSGIFTNPGDDKWFNILSPSINQYRKIRLHLRILVSYHTHILKSQRKMEICNFSRISYSIQQVFDAYMKNNKRTLQSFLIFVFQRCCYHDHN